jgi:hypothetical protein
MAFVLTGALGTFQKAMNTILAPILRKGVLVFFDDILVCSSSLEEHVRHLEQVFQLLQNDQWKVKLSKCLFAQNQVSYLGHVISQQGVATNPEKVSAVASWLSPQNIKELRGFLGLAGYYRKFVKHFGIITRPLTNLLKKHTAFVWTTTHESAFVTLKNCLISTPVLSLPDFTKTFVIETDACADGVGAVLM